MVVAFGLTLAVMNYSIYQAFARIPLGIAVTIEFLGPLAVAVAASRRAVDLLWVALAAAGVALLAHAAAGRATAHRAAAGPAWPGCVRAGRRGLLGRLHPAQRGHRAAVPRLVRPGDRHVSRRAARSPRPGCRGRARRCCGRACWPPGLAIGLLSSIIPYSLELEALRRIPAQVFGIWMSLEPAVAALVGLVMLEPERSALVRVGRDRLRDGRLRRRGPRRARDRAAAQGRWVQTGQPLLRWGPCQPTSPGRRRACPRRRRAPPPARWRLGCPVLSPTPAPCAGSRWPAWWPTPGIIMTGAAVRLSASGLGCPDWPNCTRSSLVAAHTSGDPMFHTWIEFGNRMLTVRAHGGRRGCAHRRLAVPPGRAPAGATWSGWPPPSRSACWRRPCWAGSWCSPSSTRPRCRVHFLLSSAILAPAVVLYVAVRRGRRPGQPGWSARDLRVLRGGRWSPVTALMLAAGTVVTGTGPLAGSRSSRTGGRTYVPRYHLPLEGVTQLHADIGWMLGTLVAAWWSGLQLTGAPARARRLGWLLLGLVGLQGVIGYAQYFSGLPAGLVWVHVTGSVLIWIAALRLMFATRDRGPVAGRRRRTGRAASRAVRPDPDGTGRTLTGPPGGPRAAAAAPAGGWKNALRAMAISRSRSRRRSLELRPARSIPRCARRWSSASSVAASW